MAKRYLSDETVLAIQDATGASTVCAVAAALDVHGATLLRWLRGAPVPRSDQAARFAANVRRWMNNTDAVFRGDDDLPPAAIEARYQAALARIRARRRAVS